MNYALRVSDLVERASRRVAAAEASATPANAANLLITSICSGAPLTGLAAMPERNAPLMTTEQADECHADGWNDAEIDAFTARRDRLMRWGWPEQRAEALAERLTLRDRQQDARGSCAECRHGTNTRCPDGQPLPADVLHRCISSVTSLEDPT